VGPPMCFAPGEDFDAFWDAHLKGGSRKLLFVLGSWFRLASGCGAEEDYRTGGRIGLPCLVAQLSE